MVNKYNTAACQDPANGEVVEAGQYIVEINGKSGDITQLEHTLAQSANVSAVIVKPTLYSCVVQRNGLSLGLELRYPCNYGTSLLVEQVLPEGAAARLAGDSCPQTNDRIVSVNGKMGGCQTLLEEVKKSGDVVELGMSRLVYHK